MTLKSFVKFIAAFFLFLLPYVAIADPLSEQKNAGPIEVKADKLYLDDAAGTLVFKGNAVASQDGVEIFGDSLTVKYEGESRDIKKVVAKGNVKIVQETRTATSEHAVFFRDEGRIVLTGSPKVFQGDNFVQGQEITIFLNERRSIVSGGSGGRVNAIFTPQPEGKP